MGALKYRLGGAWAYVQGLKGDKGDPGPPSVGLTTLTSAVNQTIRQRTPANDLAFMPNQIAYLNDDTTIDHTGATDTGAAVMTRIAALAAAGYTRIYCQGTYKTTTMIDVPASVTLDGQPPGYGGFTVFNAAAAGITVLRLTGMHSTLRGLRVVCNNLSGTHGIQLDNHWQTLDDIHVTDIATNGRAIWGGRILYVAMRDITINALRGYGLDFMQAYGSLSPSAYYGINVGTLERLYIFDGPGGAICAVRVCGIATLRDGDIEGVFSGPAVISDGSVQPGYLGVEDTYFELGAGGANKAMKFTGGMALATGNKIYGDSAGTAGGLAIDASGASYAYFIDRNYMNRFATGIDVSNVTSTSNLGKIGLGINYFENVTTPTVGAAPIVWDTSIYGTTRAQGTAFAANKAFYIVGVPLVHQSVKLTNPTTDAAVNWTYGNTFELAYTGAATVTATGGNIGQIVTLRASNGNATLSNAAWRLVEGADVTLASGEVREFLCGTDGLVREIGRKAKTPVVKTATFTADANADAYLCDATTGAITANLPSAATWTGGPLTVKKTDSSANAVTVDPNGTQTIDGALTLALSAQWSAVTVRPSGGNWLVTGKV